MSEATVKNSAISLTPRMSNAKSALLTVLASSMLLSGCYSTGAHVPDKTRFPESVPSGLLDYTKPDKTDMSKGELPVTQRLAIADGGATRLYSFKAMGQSLRMTMDQFAKANKLNVIFDQDVAGMVNVEFHDMTLEQALDAILDPIGVGWVQEDGAIRITRQVMRTYQLDYLLATRTKSTASGAGSTYSVDFWGSLETTLKSLLEKKNEGAQQLQETNTQTTDPQGKTTTVTARPIQQVEGRIILDKLTGSVQVVTSPRLMRSVDSFMQNLIKGMNRQVYIEARILKVALQDDAAYGIDWSRISFGNRLSINNSNIINSATGGALVKSSTGILNYDTTGGIPGTVPKPFPSTFLVNNITAAIQALEEQGTVRVVSQPRVRTLNNQPAVIKVGTDRTFYTQTTTTCTPKTVADGTCTPLTTDVPTAITEGVMLTVTPQISPDGHVTLDVVPKINKIVGVDVSQSKNSSAAQVETMESSTLVRMKDGETAVIGGLIIEEDSETGRNLPGMSNVGGPGWFFKGKYSNKVRKELVIFITPHLVDN